MIKGCNVCIGNFAGSKLTTQYGVVIIGDNIEEANSMEVKIGDYLFGEKLSEQIKVALVTLGTSIRDLQIEKQGGFDSLFLKNDSKKIKPNS